MQLDRSQVEAYLARQLGHAVQVLALTPLDAQAGAAADVSATRSVKTYGYGQPVLVQYRAASQERTAVLRPMAASPFGHERRADRAASLLLSYDTFNDLPRHVRAVDVGVLQPDGATAS
jgi:hypothetical protein